MNLVECRCGCGEKRSLTDSRGRSHHFINGHQMSGRKRPESWKKMMSAIMSGSRSHNWNPIRSEVGRHGMGFQKSQIRRLLKSSCDYCGAMGKMNLDHIVPIVGGGTNSDSNAQTLCVSCNQKKRTEELKYYKKLGELSGNPRMKWDNTEPSDRGNSIEGATTKRRACKRPKRKPARHIELVCSTCGRQFVKLERHFRPNAKQVFCGVGCRWAFYSNSKLSNGRFGGNSLTSPQQGVGNATPGRYSLNSQVTVRCLDKEPSDNII